jgi:uncharacterized membrane protein
MSLLFVLTGIAHFVWPRQFVKIVPPWVPMPLAAVYVSGVAEIALAVAAMIPSTSRWACFGVALLLIAVFPANVHHWRAAVRAGGVVLPAWYHLVRLPMQAVLIAWAVFNAQARAVSAS